MGKIERIEVPPEDRERLERPVRDRNTPQKIVWRSQIVLLTGEGIGAVQVATRVGKSVLTVWRWRRCYVNLTLHENRLRSSTSLRVLPRKRRALVCSITCLTRDVISSSSWRRPSSAGRFKMVADRFTPFNDLLREALCLSKHPAGYIQ
jgi:hypothetical protein